MKSFKKYFILLGLIAFLPACAVAEITVKETTSPEFIYNQGYSSEVSRIIKIKTKDPATPIPVETRQTVWKKTGWKLLETLDPTVDSGTKFLNHDTKYFNSVDDL